MLDFVNQLTLPKNIHKLKITKPNKNKTKKFYFVNEIILTTME